MDAEPVVDAAPFMGMHSRDEQLRARCKGFFAARVGSAMVMSLEQVGRCDDLVWRYPREVQDAYYPFMDTLHTELDICRVGYQEPDVRAALQWPALRDLAMHERLLLGLVIRRQAVLYTASPSLRNRSDLPVHPADADLVGPAADRRRFPEHLERLYQRSLVLRVADGPW